MKTWLLAETISKELGADMMEIKTAKENGHSFLFKYMWGGSQVVMGGKPPIMEPDRDWKEYDLIVLGFPVRAFNITLLIVSNLKKNHISGKKVAIFASFEGNAGKVFQRVMGGSF